MRARWLVIAMVSGLVSHATLPHGNKVHVRGTIEKVNADSLQVKTPDGKSVEVKLTATTVYLLHVSEPKPSDASRQAKLLTSTDKPAKVSDLAAGELVVIHATLKGDALEAEEVKFTVADPHKPAATPAGKQNR